MEYFCLLPLKYGDDLSPLLCPSFLALKTFPENHVWCILLGSPAPVFCRTTDFYPFLTFNQIWGADGYLWLPVHQKGETCEVSHTGFNYFCEEQNQKWMSRLIERPSRSQQMERIYFLWWRYHRKAYPTLWLISRWNGSLVAQKDWYSNRAIMKVVKMPKKSSMPTFRTSQFHFSSTLPFLLYFQSLKHPLP